MGGKPAVAVRLRRWLRGPVPRNVPRPVAFHPMARGQIIPPYLSNALFMVAKFKGKA